MVIFELERSCLHDFSSNCYEHSVQRILFFSTKKPPLHSEKGFFGVSNDNCSITSDRINAAIKTITLTLYQKKGLNTMGGEYD